MKQLFALVTLALAACAGTPPPEIREVIVSQEVKVPVPVPCGPLGKLGSEPTFSDPPAALRAASDIFEQVRLLLLGRTERDKRLAEYRAARRACEG